MKIIKKTLKWTAITLLVLIIFIIAAPFLFKGKIVQFVKDQANANLNATVNFGEFDLTLISSFPNFTLSVDNVSVANKGDFLGDTLFSAKNLTVSLNLMSVIKGDQYKIRKVSLENARILAKVLKNGKASWDITKPSADTAKAAPSESSPFKMSLKKLEIKNAHIVYDDASMGVMTLLDGFNYTMSGDFSSDNFTMENDMAIDRMTVGYGGVSYLNKVNTKVKADIDADMKNMKFTFKDNEIGLNELGLAVDGFFAMPKEGYDMDMKFKAKQTEFKNFLSLVPSAYTKDFSSVKTSGKLGLDGFIKGMMTDKQMPAFALNVKINDAMFQYPSLPKAVNDINVDVDINNKTGNPDATVINVNKFHMEMAGNPVDAVMNVSTPVSDPNISGKLFGKIDLSSLKQVLPLEKNDNLNGNITMDVKMKGRMSSIQKQKYEDFDAKGQVIVMDMNYKSKDMPATSIKSMTLNFSPQAVELAGFDSKIDSSDIKADGRIENFLQYVFKDSLLRGRFDMKSSLINLNEFMSSSSSTTATATPAAVDTSKLSVITVPSNVDFTLNSTIGRILYDNMEMSNVAGAVIVKDSRVDLSQLKMNTMGGSMVVDGSYDTKNPKAPKVKFNLNISDVDIAQTYKTLTIVQQMAPIAKFANGRVSTNVRDLTMNLDPHMMPDMKTLSGTGELHTKSVSVSGFEPLNKLADELRIDKFRKTDFSDLDINYEIKDGKLTTKAFPFKSGSVVGQAFGSTAIDQTIDYTMNMEIPTADMPDGAKQFLTSKLSAVNALGTSFKLPEKVKIGALFGGTAMKPTLKTNFGNMASSVKDAVKDQVKETVKEKVIEPVKKNVEEQKKKILDEAAKQAQAIRDGAKQSADQVRTEGYAQATKLEAEAKNPIAKIAAKKAAEKLRKESDEKAQKIIDEGNAKADKSMADAKAKADAIK